MDYHYETVIEGAIKGVVPVRNTVNGNTIRRVLLNDGRVFETEPDSSVSFVIEGYRYDNEVFLLMNSPTSDPKSWTIIGVTTPGEVAQFEWADRDSGPYYVDDNTGEATRLLPDEVLWW